MRHAPSIAALLVGALLCGGCHDFSLFDHFDLASDGGVAPDAEGTLDASESDRSLDLAVNDLNLGDLPKSDLAGLDLAIADLAQPDLAAPDFAVPRDLIMPDFGGIPPADLSLGGLMPDLAMCQPVACGNRCGMVLNDCGQPAICACANGMECAPNGQCCAYSGDNAFCNGKCGTVTAIDNCGIKRAVACADNCVAPQTCAGGNVPNVCGCTYSGDRLFCNGACGTLTKTDNCGMNRSVPCGGCNGLVCFNNACCAAESDQSFCQRLRKDCGMLMGNDNCGTPRSARCGGCNPEGQTPACIDNVCTKCQSANDCTSGLAICSNGLCVAGCNMNADPSCPKGLGMCMGVCECHMGSDCFNPRADTCTGPNGICVCGGRIDSCPSGTVCIKGTCQ